MVRWYRFATGATSLVAFAALTSCGHEYTQDEYVTDWIEAQCGEMFSDCPDDAQYWGTSEEDCVAQLLDEAGDAGVAAYFMVCPDDRGAAWDPDAARACMDAIETQEVGDGECAPYVGELPECTGVCRPDIG